MKIVESIKAMTWKDVVVLVVVIVVAAPGIKAGLGLIGGALSYLAGAIK